MDETLVTKRRRRPEIVAHKGFVIPTYTNDSDSDSDDVVPQKRLYNYQDGTTPSTSSIPKDATVKIEDGKTTSQANSKMKMVMDLFRKHHQKRGFNYFSHSIIEEIRQATTNQPLLDMAIAIEGASQVYSYRVETTMMHCKETHDICVGAKTKTATDGEIEITESGELAVDEAATSTKKKRRKTDDLGAKDNYQNRMADLWENIGKQQGVTTTEELEIKKDDSEEESSDEDEDEEESEIDAFLRESASWNGKIDITEKIFAEREERLLNLDHNKLIESNPKLVTDSSSLKVRRKESRQNSYYAAAIYNKNRNYSHRIFTMNCIRTPDSRRFILHARSIPDPADSTSFHKPYPKEFLDSVAGLCDNTLSDKPQSYGYFFPKTTINTKDKALGVDGEEEDYLLEQNELDDVMTNQREEDSTIMVDRTLMDATMANRTVAFGGGGGPRRVTLKGLGEKQIRMADLVDSFVGASIDPKLSMALADMANNIYENKLVSRNGIRSYEFNLSNETTGEANPILEETRCVRLFGFGPIIAQLEASWHAEYVQLFITREDFEDQIHAINDWPQEKKEQALKSVLPPGRYKLFVAPSDPPHNYPRDPAANLSLLEEPDHLHMTTEMSATFSVLNDPFNDSGDGGIMGIDGDLDSDLAPVPTMDMLMDNNANNDAPKEANLPLSEQDIAYEAETRQEEVTADLDLQKIGKLDDAHWNKKTGKERSEKDEQLRKEQREEKKLAHEQFLSSFNLPLDDFVGYHESLASRFDRAPDIATLEKNYLMTQKQIQELIQSRLSESHKVQDLYDFNQFTMPRFLNRGRFGHCDIKPIRAPDKPLRKLPRFPGLDDDSCDDEDEDSEDPNEVAIYTNWMSAFALCYEPDEKATALSKDFHSQENNEGGLAAPADTGDFDDGGGFDDFGDGPGAHVSPKRRKNPFTFEHARMMLDAEEPIHEIEPDKEAMNEEDVQLLEQMLELARGAKQQRVDTLQVKLAIKQLLGNNDLEDGHLKRVARGMGYLKEKKNTLPIEADNNFITPSGSSDKENEEKELDQSETEKDADDAWNDPVSRGGVENKIKEALTAPPVDVEAADVEEVEGMNDEEDDEHNVSLRVTNFDVEGEHSFSSLVSMLPLRLPAHDRQIHIATTLVIALHMCNENGLICEQQRSSSDGLDSSNWMSDFVFKNGNDELAD